ncbi:MAG: altronate dehydratase family protein [Lentisphaeria bacterium]|nr:altronate dehydratase family protein [Lentisphaeria bacterium]
MSTRHLIIHNSDNCAVALTNLEVGEQLAINENVITLVDAIPAKHKFAIADMPKGTQIYQYGVLVGEALSDIPVGGLMTIENVVHRAEEMRERNANFNWTAPNIDNWKTRTFKGFKREDGQFGTQNVWLVIPLVFCENRNVSVIEQSMLEELGFAQNKYRNFVKNLSKAYQDGSAIDKVEFTTEESQVTRMFKQVDGIRFLRHTGGCGGASSDCEALSGLLAGYVTSPNVAGATILSLGCQKTQFEMLKRDIEARCPNYSRPMYFLEQQKSASEESMVSQAIRATFEGLTIANKATREEAPISAIKLGLECGGSDGFSGISANPLIGVVSDRLSALGASPVLAEFPELCGVEQNIVDRCLNDDVANKFRRVIGAYADRAEALGEGFDNNPSFGNIKDGLITDAIKSAGAARKGGTAPVAAILDYTEQITEPGLNLLNTPGNDVESTTAMAGSGCNVIVFSTGLGTPTGNPVTPVIKIATNNALSERLPDIIDFNAGPIISGEKSLEEMADELLELILDVASGKKTKAMILDQNDFIPWKRGLSL